ncbi:MAG: AAA family ATPase [Bacteroidaceae bacterium]|uniref:AAA family ATPase n=1 Tax=Xylanibacter oryzae TaxID=185293 RepID=UPI0004BCA1E3|nr:AAA family ATPase [Xylanibacter oryzae]
MLTKFAVKNYRGFANKIEWDLSHPSSYSFNQNAIKDGVVKNGIVYGPNGSGKSNFCLAIFDIANHLSHKWKKPDYYVNYASAYGYQQPVEFEYTFKFGEDTVSYNYSKVTKELKGELVSENLLLNGKELLYKDTDTLRLADDFVLTDAAIENLKGSANNISIVNYLLGAVPLAKDHALLKLSAFVENMLFFRSLDNREFIGLKEGGSNIEEYIINNNYVDDFATFLDETSHQKFTFAKPVQGEKTIFCMIGDVKIPFLLVASTGTLNLELQYFWLKEMVNAPFVFIDEFDAFYHHELSYAICERLFKSENQVFVTTHDTFLLSNDLLRPDCFFILKDNNINAICDLTDKELRFGHNLEKLYRGGTFGL